MERFNDNNRAELHDIVVRVSVLEERSVNMDRRLDSTDKEIILLRDEVKETKDVVFDMRKMLLNHTVNDEKAKNRILLFFILIMIGVLVPEVWPWVKPWLPIP